MLEVRRVALAWGGAVLTSPAVAAEGGNLGRKLIEPEFGTIFWTVVTFLALAFLLAKVAWKPLLGALEARERSIRESLDQARNERAEAEGLLEQHRRMLAEARREHAALVAGGKQDAERVKQEILEAARRQKEQLLRQAEEQIQAEIRGARSELRGLTADLVVRAAGKLLEKNLDDPSQRKLVEEYLADLERRGENPSTPPS